MRAWPLAIALGLVATLEATAADPPKPNILVILVDDVGYGEFGFQGAKDIPTPHIDSIAREGVRFTQGYVSGPYCSPTRAGLMTGRYQTRFGHEFNSTAGASGLSLEETTIADRLKSAGYATAAIGKWHLGFNASPRYRPTARGFDEFYGTVANTSFFTPRRFVDSRKSIDDFPIEDPGFYTTDAYAARASAWIRDHKDQPWFLYLPFNAQHAPLQAPDKYLDRFPHIEDPTRKAFAAVMSGLDDAVGQTLAALRETGQDERTLVVFLSDNGGPTRQTTSSNGPLRGFKATTWEGGVRVPFAMRWTGTLPAGATFEKPIIQLDILPTALAAAGVPIDPAWKLDGVDLLPYLTGKNDGQPHETLYWRFGEQWAIRHGDWKLVKAALGGGEPELYNVQTDSAESRELSAEHPDKVRELRSLYDSWNAEQAPPSAPREQLGTPKKNAAARKKAATRKKAESAPADSPAARP